MEKVRCPYCGAEMRPCRVDTVIHVAWWNCPECRSVSPSCRAGDQKTVVEMAHAAAMRRWQEPNRVLTWDEFLIRNELYPVWMESRTMPCRSQWFEPDNEFVNPPTEEETALANKLYCKECRAWLRRPTDKERMAAKWEDEG